MTQKLIRVRQLDSRWWGPALAYTGVGLCLWPLPVFGVLHAESAAVVAAAAFFIALWAGVSAFRQLESLRAVMQRHLLFLILPWSMLTASLIWRPNCAYVAGLGIALVLVPPSAVLGVALAYALTGAQLRVARLWGIVIGVAVAVGGIVADLGFHPQLFTYNHVFGGILGPIYDEELVVRPGLFAFRTLTLLWALALILAGRVVRVDRSERPRLLRASVGLWVLIGATYVLAVPLGIQQSQAALEVALGARTDVGPYRIVYDPDNTEPEALRRIEDELLFRAHQLEAVLGRLKSEPIRVYLYPDANTKGALIGSRETSVVPVWLAQPQIHMLVEEVERSAGHELVHVFARDFGMPILKASPAVGLVEGLAVALEPPNGLPTPTDLVLATQQRDIGAEGLEQDPADVARATISPLGFWTARAGVAYTTSGAFVRWLLDSYGLEPFRMAYRTGRIERAYGQPIELLAAAWAGSLDGQEASAQAVELAEDLLTRRSLFERPCPHHVATFVRDTRAGAEALEGGYLDQAEEAFARAMQQEPTFEPALVGWATTVAARGNRVLGDSLLRLEKIGVDSLTGPEALVALADLHRISGSDMEADRLYSDALGRTPSYAPLTSALIRLRRSLSKKAVQTLRSHPNALERSGADVKDHAPVHGALLWDAVGDPDAAWAIAQQWKLDSLASSPVDRAALRSVQARLAYRVGAWSRAESLARAAARAYRREGHPGPAAFADDWAARSRWRRDAFISFAPPPLSR